MKKKSIILPINKEPYLKSYTHNTYISSVLSSALVGGDVVAKYEIIKKNIDWKIIDKHCKTEMGKEIVVFDSCRYEKGHSIVYSECKENDELVVKVQFRRMASAWEQICLVVDDKIPEPSFDYNNCVVKFGCPVGQKLYVKRKQTFATLDKPKRIMEKDFYLKIDRKELELNFFYSYDGKKWHYVYSDFLPKMYKLVPLYLGVMVESSNEYKNWLAGNYIQLYMKKLSGMEMMIDYFSGGTKHYKTYITNHYMNFLFEYFDADKLSCRKLRNIVYNRLNNGYYVIMEVNHYYIPRTAHFQKNTYYHEIMIYGIDICKGIYYIMGYGDKNVVFTYELGVKELWKALNFAEVKLIIGKIDVNVSNYFIDRQMIKKRLHDYLLGYDNGADSSDILPQLKMEAYGLEILRRLLREDDDLFVFCSDIRLPYLIYEHKKLMLDRVLYLLDNIDGLKESEDEILRRVEENVKNAQIIKNSILMNSLTSSKKSTMKKIRGYLERIIENEEVAYSILCKNL